MFRYCLPILAAVSMTACSARQDGADDQTRQAGADTVQQEAPTAMAYGYSYAFDVPEAAIGAAQARHVEQCERLGPGRCRVLETHRTTGDYARGSVKLEVASVIARQFGAGLAGPVAALGGALSSSDVQAKDVGRTIVDVAARMRAKTMLVDRLNQALRTRGGSVADLVATEKAVADAQGELDAVRSELRQVQGRVATSPVDISYARRASFGADIGRAFDAIGATMSASVVALVYFLAAAMPWIALGTVLFLAGGWLRRRRRAAVARRA